MEYALPRERTPRGGAARAGDDRAARLRGAVPDRGAHGRARRRVSQHGGRARQRLRRGAHVRGHGVASRTSARSSDHGRARRAPALGQAPLPDGRTLRPRYPDWDRFQAVRARLDPHGRFANAWTDRVLGPVARSGEPRAVAAERAYARLERATAGPAGAVRAGRPRRAATPTPTTWNGAPRGKPIRLASKSLRCRALQERVLARDGFRGTLAFTLPEALWLAAQGAEDIARRLPDRRRAARCARWPSVAPAGRDHGDGRQRRAARAARAGDRAAARSGAVRVCIDVDAGWRALGGRVRIGVKRSPAHTPEQAGELAARDRRARRAARWSA